MILIDLSQTLWNVIHAQVPKMGEPISKGLIKHLILNTIRTVRTKYRNEFGEIVICCDGKNYWRKNIFPYYKAQRKEQREKSKLPMDLIFETLDEIKIDLKENFPYIVIEVDTAEADDIISTLVRANSSESNLIYSSDTDFWQLAKYGCKQINPVTKKIVKKELTPEEYKMQHIIKGDRGDGIPNVFSPPDAFIKGIRQKPVRSKDLKRWVKMTPEQFCEDSGVSMERFMLNKKIIDLDEIPEYIVKNTLNKFYNEKPKTPIGGWANKILKYFAKERMKHLSECLDEFICGIGETNFEPFKKTQKTSEKINTSNNARKKGMSLF